MSLRASRCALAALLDPPMPAVAGAVEVPAADHVGAAAVEVHANLVPGAAARAAGTHVRERRQGRHVDGLRRHTALYYPVGKIGQRVPDAREL